MLPTSPMHNRCFACCPSRSVVELPPCLLYHHRFGSAGLGKVVVLPWDRHTWQEVAAICAYMAWSPLLLWLIRCRWVAGWADTCGAGAQRGTSGNGSPLHSMT